MAEFESAVAVVDGDVAVLERLLREDPELVRARSPRPHRATLLHYVAANGVEDDRQRTPANAVEVARMLLRAGAEVDAVANMYGGQATTMSMLVSSQPPARAGLQVALVETLLDFGAAIEGPLMTALAFGYRDAAEVWPGAARGPITSPRPPGWGGSNRYVSCCRGPIREPATAHWRWPRSTGMWISYAYSSMRAKILTVLIRTEIMGTPRRCIRR